MEFKHFYFSYGDEAAFETWSQNLKRGSRRGQEGAGGGRRGRWGQVGALH